MQAARPCSKETACGHDVYKVTLAKKIYTPVIDLVLGGFVASSQRCVCCRDSTPLSNARNTVCDP